MLEWEDMTFEQRLYVKMKSEKSFLNFTRLWFELLQGDEMLVNWHHRWIAQEVDKIIRHGENKNIAISIPPGGTKTEFMSIHAPAYTNMLTKIGVIKRFRNLNLSFADTLVKRNSRRTRDIISSKEYQELWPCRFGVNQAEEWEVIDDKGKVKASTVSRSMGGQITGGRGGYFGPSYSGSVNLDDPDKPEDMFSTTKREAQHRKLVNTVRSRRGDKSKEHPTPFMVIQQRLHTDDTIGFCVSGGLGVDFELIKIPALITRDFIDSLPSGIRERCESDVLSTESRLVNGIEYWSYWPEMEHIDQLVELWERDEYTFNSQYQQSPTKISGGLIDTVWFNRYEIVPYFEYMAVYVDTNSGKIKDKNDYTVFTLAGKTPDGDIYLLDMRRGKWDPLGLQKQLDDLWVEWSEYAAPLACKLRYASIEDKQAGQGLIQTNKTQKRIPIKDVQRGTNEGKWVRHNNCQPHIKMGKVYVPSIHDESGAKITNSTLPDGKRGFSTHWVSAFLQECDLLTTEVLMDQESGYDDQYDTVMDVIEDMTVITKSRTSRVKSIKRR